MKKSIVIPVAIIGIVIIITVGAGIAISAHKSANKTAATIPAASTAATASPLGTTGAATTAAATTYKDGTYTSTGSYTSPGGNQTIGVSLTIKSDVITAVTVTPEGTDNESQEYEGKFASGISQVVVGKSLAASFDVSEVNGSSLTGAGFSTALQAIRTKATA